MDIFKDSESPTEQFLSSTARMKSTSLCKCDCRYVMPSAEECIRYRKLQVKQIHIMQHTDVDCIPELETFRVHLHPSILETFFKMNP